jgi:hypothetical protein
VLVLRVGTELTGKLRETATRQSDPSSLRFR